MSESGDKVSQSLPTVGDLYGESRHREFELSDVDTLYAIIPNHHFFHFSDCALDRASMSAYSRPQRLHSTVNPSGLGSSRSRPSQSGSGQIMRSLESISAMPLERSTSGSGAVQLQKCRQLQHVAGWDNLWLDTHPSQDVCSPGFTATSLRHLAHIGALSPLCFSISPV